MGLRNWLEEQAADIIPGGKTGASMRAAKVAPPPAQLPTKFSPLAQQRILARNPGAQAQINAGPVMPRITPQAPKPTALETLGGGFMQGMPTLGLAAKRTAIGTAQGVSGLADLASKGTGTSRVSDYLERQAVGTDNRAKELNVEDSYKAAQVPLNVASFAVPGLGAAGIASKVPQVAKAAQVMGKVTKPLDNVVGRVTTRLAGQGAGARIAAAGVRGLATPQMLLNAGVGTALDLGTESGKGRDISGTDVAISAGMNLGLGAALPAGAQTVAEGVGAIRPGVNKTKVFIGNANTKQTTNEEIKRQQTQLLNKQRSLEKQKANTPPEDTIANNNIDGALDSLQTQYNELEAKRQKMSTVEKIITKRPGMSMKAVGDTPEPTGNDLMRHFSDMRKKYANDDEFYDKVVLNNQEAPGMIGQLSRSIAREIETKGSKITDELDYQLKVDNKATVKAEADQGKLTDLKQMARQMERDTGQTGLYNKLAQNMKGMDADQQITYLTDGLKQARESGAMAAAHINKQSGYTPKQQTPTDAKQLDSGSSAATDSVDVPPAQLPGAAIPPQPPEVPGTGQVSSPDNMVNNRLTQGGKDGRQNLSPETQAKISGKHAVRSTQGLDDAATAQADGMDTQNLITQTDQRLGVELGKINDSDVALANKAIERADLDGRTEDAVRIHNALSEHLVKQGQTIQAASLLYRLSPNGMYYKAVQDIKKAGGTVTPELEAKLRQQTQDIGNANGSASKITARAKFGKTVVDNIPRGKVSDIISVWKAGLLSGSKTFSGGVVSNTTFAGFKKVSDIPAALIDKGFSLATGKRTKVATTQGAVSGFIEGTKKGFNTLKTGIDERNVSNGGKYEQYGELNFKNSVIQTVFGKPSNYVFRGLSSLDQPIYYAAAKNNLYDLAKVQAINQKVPQAERKAFIDNLVKNPSKDMAQKARDAAEKAVLQQDTVAAKVINGAKGTIDRMDIPPVAKATATATIDILAPFVRVPSAFISRTVDFTPLGIGREVFEQISKKKFDQRKMSEALGQGITGTGVIALGIALSQAELLSGNYPKNDQKEAQRWKAEGIEANSIKIHDSKTGKDKWLSLNYVGPIGLLFNAGKQFDEAKDEAALSKIAASVGGLGQGLLGQSFLQGFSGFSDAITDPERNASSFVKSQASSLIPAWSNDLANLGDDYQRQADTVWQSMKNRIPGQYGRESNPIKQDVYGNDLGEKTTGINHTNPLKPSDANSSTVLNEVARLHNVDKKNTDLQVTPSPVGRTISVSKQEIKLTDKQRYDLQKQVGQTTQAAWNEIIQTDEYKALDDIDKAKALSGIRQDAAAAAQREYVVANNIATYDDKDKPTKKVARFLQGTANVAGYAKTSSSDSDAETYAEKYEAALADQKTGNYTGIEKIKKTKEIKKLSVQKDYDNDTVDLYSMSKADVYSYLSTHEDGNALKDKLIKYGDALEAAGLDTNKFRNSNGAVSIRPKEKGSGGGSGGNLAAYASLYSGAYNPLSMDKKLRDLVAKARL